MLNHCFILFYGAKPVWVAKLCLHHFLPLSADVQLELLNVHSLFLLKSSCGGAADLLQTEIGAIFLWS